ncbi:hypothetical protein EZS27_023921 [termite gut metagenome]|jgi:Zn-dependent peptidase ImmA (M78 family)|uniref:HTH cro/C1-type domain-containing protein n=1 Tax=termite gut metagenome TaxID=433724 RepID=A0A5J4QYN7_9ZZZZ
MNASLNFSMLETARLFRGYTQKEASVLLGISQGKLSKAEMGMQSFDENMLQTVVSVYDFPMEFFYDNHENSLDGHFYFRRKLSISGKELAKLLAKTKVFKRIIDILFMQVEIPDFRINLYNTKDCTPEEIAKKIRYEMRIYKGKVPHLVNLLEYNGIIIFPFDFETDKMDGLSVITVMGNKVIFLNSRMPEDRKRFSLSHELGHLIMHFDSISKYPELIEDEANSFASEFLLPKDEVINELSYLDFEHLGNLKKKWGVSMRSIVRRAKELNRINEQTYRNIQINFSKKGYSKKEPIFLPIERPTLISDTIQLYKKELGYEDNDLQKLMKLNSSDFYRFFGNHPHLVLSMSKNN